MLRRLFNTLIETTFQVQPEYSFATPAPFTQNELSHLGWLSSVAPCFPIREDSITILTEPNVFYSTLVKKSNEAKFRITLASLYLGTGRLEQVLVDTINQNPNFASGNLKLSVLLDYTRGSRCEINSRTVLLPLLQKREENCQISLYHTPVLRGLKRKFAPARWNELFGLQHMKLYIFDDTLIISGANLSNDYFTNRQDRYFVINDKSLADFYDGLISKVQKFSLRLNAENKVGLDEGWTCVPYAGSKNDFVRKAGESVYNYVVDAKDVQDRIDYKGYDTWIFPLIQMGQLGIDHDALVTEKLLAEAPLGTKLFMATGYFNLTPRYVQTIIKESQAQCSILMAHPDANGFQGAKGIAGGIPAAYTLIARKFRNQLENQGHSNRISLFEYLRKGWTYHGKGLWYYPSGMSTPCLTLIGSPNFGERSVQKDLETQIAVVTENADLREKMHNECQYLYRLGLPADTERDVPKWVHPMVYFFRGYF